MGIASKTSHPMLSFLLSCRFNFSSLLSKLRTSMLEFDTSVTSVGDCSTDPVFGDLGDWVSSKGVTTVPNNIVQPNCSLSKKGVAGLNKRACYPHHMSCRPP